MNAQATPEQPLEAGLNAVARALAEGGLGDIGTLRIVKRFEGGQSNPTFLLRSEHAQLVLRKQPDGKLLPRAHDVLREYAIMNALHGQGFPVPKPLYASRDREILGTDFFVMEYVPGQVEANPALPDRTPEERRRIYAGMAHALARLHTVDVSALLAAGLSSRPDFVRRQVATWRKQYLASQTEQDDRVEAVADWLDANCPAPSKRAVVHGDYRVENLILGRDGVAAVLDWELAAIGEPLCDLAYASLWYHLPSEMFDGLAAADLASLGIPDEAAFIDNYSAAAGIDGHSHRAYYLAFSFYRLAAILQGVFSRALQGNAASAEALRRGSFSGALLKRSIDLIERG